MKRWAKTKEIIDLIGGPAEIATILFLAAGFIFFSWVTASIC